MAAPALPFFQQQGIFGTRGIRRSVLAFALGLAAYPVQPGDHVLSCAPSVAMAVTLPGNPQLGDEYEICDGTGQASAGTPITVSASNGANINGAATNVIATAFGGITVKWNGTLWLVTQTTGGGGGGTLAGDVTGPSGANTVVQITGNAGVLNILSTASTFSWAAAATPVLTQAAAGVGVTPASFVVSPQTFNAGSTTAIANTPGSFVVNVTAPGVNTVAGTEGGIKLQRVGVTIFIAQQYTGAAFFAMYMGSATASAPTGVNYALLADNGGTTTYLNGPTSLILRVNNADQLNFTTTLAQFKAGSSLAINGTASLGGGVGVLGMLNATTFPTTAPTGGGVIAHDTIGLHYTPPDASAFVDYMLAPVRQGNFNTQKLKNRQYLGTARTTDAATGILILTVPVAITDSIGSFIVFVNARDVTAGTVGDGFTKAVLYQYKNVAGLVTAAAVNAVSIAVANDTSMATCAITAAVSGTNIQLTVNGLAGVTIDWTVTAVALTT